MEGIELVAFQIIAAVGSARSFYIEAIQAAKAKNFEEAKNLIKEGDKVFVEGHHAHADLIQQEASKNKVELNLILMHAEDQLMSADSFKVVAEELIEAHERLSELESEIKGGANGN